MHPNLAIKKALSDGRMCIRVTGIKGLQMCFSSWVPDLLRLRSSIVFFIIILSFHFLTFNVFTKIAETSNTIVMETNLNIQF